MSQANLVRSTLAVTSTPFAPTPLNPDPLAVIVLATRSSSTPVIATSGAAVSTDSEIGAESTVVDSSSARDAVKVSAP